MGDATCKMAVSSRSLQDMTKTQTKRSASRDRLHPLFRLIIVRRNPNYFHYFAYFPLPSRGTGGSTLELG